MGHLLLINIITNMRLEWMCVGLPLSAHTDTYIFGSLPFLDELFLSAFQ